jgi:hypothetical protein
MIKKLAVLFTLTIFINHALLYHARNFFSPCFFTIKKENKHVKGNHPSLFKKKLAAKKYKSTGNRIKINNSLAYVNVKFCSCYALKSDKTFQRKYRYGSIPLIHIRNNSPPSNTSPKTNIS